MPKKSCTDAEFIATFSAHGAAETARIIGIDVRSVYDRRRRIESRIDQPLNSPNSGVIERAYPARIPLEVENGVVICGSDCHYWPGEPSVAHRAFVHLARELQPVAVVLNGDAFDGAKISRHPPLGFEHKPSVKEELRTVEARTDEIRLACPSAKRFWMLGNHDQRFENRLAANAGEFQDVQGFSLKDHFPHWTFGISLWINGHTVVKHRFKGGVHATHQNTLNAGKNMVTGHLHSLKVTPFSDYNGTRFGVDTGTMENPYAEQFSYGEDNPLNHRSGFVVLTFHNRALLWPEIVAVLDEKHVQFRGKVIEA